MANLNLNSGTLSYHIHLAQKRGFLTSKDITSFLEVPEMKSAYEYILNVRT